MFWTILILFSIIGGLYFSLHIGKSNIDEKYKLVVNFIQGTLSAFIGVFVALYFNNINLNQSEKDSTKKLLKSSLIELSNNKNILESIPVQVELIKSKNSDESDLTISEYFKHNKLSFPEFTERVLLDISVAKNFSESGMYNLITAKKNLEKVFLTLECKTCTDDKMTKYIKYCISEIETLEKLLTWEYRYQNDQISNETMQKFTDKYLNEKYGL